MFEIDPACVFHDQGLVKVDHTNFLARRSLPKSKAWFVNFLKSDVYAEAVEKGWLPKATPCDIADDKFYWFDVEYFHLITRVKEWCGTQIADAYRVIGDLQVLLVENGYAVSEPHLGNVIYTPKPMMLDLGDIINMRVNPAFAIVQGIVPHGHGRGKIKNWEKVCMMIAALHRKASNPAIKMPLLDGVRFARDIYHKMEPFNKPGEWSNYASLPLPGDNDFSRNTSHKTKGDSFYNIMKDKSPKTLIDFGCHTGYYSFMAASLGVKTLGMDITEDAVATAYHTANKSGADCSFVVANLLDLPPAVGGGQKIEDRVTADAGIAPALSHHLTRAGGDFKTQAAMFDKFIRDWIAVEFVPKEDIHVQNWAMPEWYTRDNYIKAFQKYWPKVTILPSFPEPRCILLFER